MNWDWVEHLNLNINNPNLTSTQHHSNSREMTHCAKINKFKNIRAIKLTKSDSVDTVDRRHWFAVSVTPSSLTFSCNRNTGDVCHLFVRSLLDHNLITSLRVQINWSARSYDIEWYLVVTCGNCNLKTETSFHLWSVYFVSKMKSKINTIHLLNADRPNL